MLRAKKKPQRSPARLLACAVRGGGQGLEGKENAVKASHAPPPLVNACAQRKSRAAGARLQHMSTQVVPVDVQRNKAATGL